MYWSSFQTVPPAPLRSDTENECQSVQNYFIGLELFILPEHMHNFCRKHLSCIAYTVCPTRYRTRHFSNNSNTNEDIATKFEQEYVRCVWYENECVSSAPNCCDTEQRSASQPGSVASGTQCICNCCSLLYRVRHKSVNTPLRHKSVNTPLRHKSVNTPLSHERLVVRTWLAVYSGWG